jgi:hypothetical protein
VLSLSRTCSSTRRDVTTPINQAQRQDLDLGSTVRSQS